MDYHPAVVVRDAYKFYSKKCILEGLNMTLHKGSIYGLLGASGCGKTTLLSCIVGRKRLNSGTVTVLGGTPGTAGSGVPGVRVGYMPQEISLIAEFTVRDAVYFFGRILEVKDKVIEERFKFFSELLELPPENRYLKNCSGGQKRRVSFAAAMINMPELLILDEPTAGVDPVLRDSIWNYLVETTTMTGISVIITTHYIEEARQANVIGLMRGGKLLAEESPSRLLAAFNTDSLEEVFLTLSRRQEEGQLEDLQRITADQNGSVINQSNISFVAANNNENGQVPANKQKQVKITKSSFSCNRMRALMDKNWKQFYRNIPGVVFLMIFPLIQTCLFLSAIGNDIKNVPIAVVNEENWMNNCSNFNIENTAMINGYDCEFKLMSCRFLKYADIPMVELVHYATLEEAKRSVEAGDTVGVMYMAKNFTECLEQRIRDGRFTDDDAMTFSEIKVWLDMSNRQIGETLKYELLDLYLDFQKDVLKDCNYLEKLGKIPMNFKEMYGSRDDTYSIFMYPGAVLTIIFFMGTLMTSQIIITDRCEGIWDRSAVAGVTSFEITVTHFILQASVIFVNMLEILLTVYVMYHYDYLGSMWAIGVIVYIQGLAGMVYGFWISVISVNHSMANIATCGSFYPMILLCGMLWPLEGMPVVLQWVAKCMPFTIATQSYRNVVKKGWPITHLEVLDGISVGVAWIFIFGAISIYMIKKKQ